LIGTHWSKGWIIENNVISHSICSGIALGKYGDEWDNTSANSAEGYVKTIERALKNGWNKETIGHHIVRNNTISHCEQAGIVGSLGAAFSVVTGNTIHDIHVRRLFTGAEMAGIKFHAPLTSRSAEITSTGPAGDSGWTGWPRARACPKPLSTTTKARTCSSRWITGRSWWTTTFSFPRQPYSLFRKAAPMSTTSSPGHGVESFRWPPDPVPQGALHRGRGIARQSLRR
jgi:hypothetical protein